MPRHAAARRSAFTLLEVVLAMAISMLLLAALYFALNIQVQTIGAARDKVEQAALARSLLNRMANDIAPGLAPVNPNRNRTQTTSGTSTTGTQGTGTTPPASTTPSTTGGDTSAPADAATPQQNVAALDLRVRGDLNTLALYVTRIPRDFNPALLEAGLEVLPGVGDIRQVRYFLSEGSADVPAGLMRQEIKRVTAIDQEAPSPDELPILIAEEVRSLQFRYLDPGTRTWVEYWPVQETEADGVTAMGPPAAIEIILGVLPVGAANRATDGTTLKLYRHVVTIQTANGLAQQTQQQATTGTGTTGTGQ